MDYQVYCSIACMYVCMYVCMYGHIYIYIYMSGPPFHGKLASLIKLKQKCGFAWLWNFNCARSSFTPVEIQRPRHLQCMLRTSGWASRISQLCCGLSHARARNSSVGSTELVMHLAATIKKLQTQILTSLFFGLCMAQRTPTGYMSRFSKYPKLLAP
jgi:hypothetical protein